MTAKPDGAFGDSGSARVVRRPRLPRPDEALAWGISFAFLGLLVALPLAAVILKAQGAGLETIVTAVRDPAGAAALRLSFGSALGSALVNVLMGTIVAWVLVRYRFAGRSLANAVVDLPFALPTAVAGITLSELFSPRGWFGSLGTNLAELLQVAPASLGWLDMKYAYTPAGVFIAMTFVSLPFTVRAVQPVLESLERDVEEAARSLGATPWRTFTDVVLPSIRPAMLAGLALSFARSLGEFGSVVIISGNIPMSTLTGPVLIFQRLEQYDTVGATAIASVMLAASFATLLLINAVRWRAGVRRG